MPLLEKAYAKFHMNYDRIGGGSSYDAMRTLTGLPVHRYGISPKHRDWYLKLHKYYASKKFPMTTSCCEESGYGLMMGHAYGLLDVQSV